MHKIKKGIKKKIKGKKGKHDDDEIFTEEELEQYKREKAEEAKRLAQHRADINPLDEEEEEEFDHQQLQLESQDSSPPENGKEDWKSFLATTDVVLKETVGNLEHIKEVSYYQTHIPERADERRPELGLIDPTSQRGSTCVSPVAAAPTKNWVDLEKGGFDDNEDNSLEQYNDNDFVVPSQELTPPPKKKFVELKPIEDFPEVSAEDYADVFDTAFVDDVEKGDLKFIIPDSPVEEFSNEPDPFDTSVADKVLHVEEPEPEPEVIVGRKNKSELPKKRKIQLVSLGNAVDVLTGKTVSTPTLKNQESKEENEVNLLGDNKTEEETSEEKNKSIDKEEEDSDKTELSDNKAENSFEAAVEESKLNDILFNIDEPIDQLPDIVVPLQETEENTKLENKILEEKVNIDEFLPINENDSSEFTNSKLNDLLNEFESHTGEDNCTDTSTILKKEEDPILDEFDAEFASLAHASIAKDKEKEIDELGVEDGDDPFDTSHIVSLTEEENREEDKSVPNKSPSPSSPSPKTKHDLLGDDNETDPFDTSIAFHAIPTDHLQSTENDTDLADTLQPVALDDPLNHSESFDPFDTSAADAFGVTELKVLESELLSKPYEEVDNDSEFDFNPREEEEPKQEPNKPCLLSTEDDNNVEGKILSPVDQLTIKEEEDFDPFDTSIADKIQIETLEEILEDPPEILHTIQTESNLSSKPIRPPRPTSPCCLLVASPTAEDTNVALKPQSQFDCNQEEGEEFDPFDTSIADAYGKTELKVLEAELLTETETENTVVSDRSEEKEKPSHLEVRNPPPRPPSPACLLAATPIDENPTLVPQLKTEHQSPSTEEFDPFDTSIAAHLGKTELHVLESELLEPRPQTQLSNCDDFDPRAVSPEIVNSELKTVDVENILDKNIEFDTPTIQPTDNSEADTSKDFDPFDTSIANNLGKSEAKYLEEEIFIEDNSHVNAEKLTSEIIVSNDCLLATTPTDSCEPLQPITKPKHHSETKQVEEVDPFDTSIANQFGKTEIKELEEKFLTSGTDCIKPKYPENLKGIDLSEEIDPFDTSAATKTLNSNSSIKRSLSDDDFDPRQEEIKRLTQQSSLLDSTEDSDFHKTSEELLKPQPISESTLEEDEAEIDPFDTSIAANIVPGKTEIRLLESELL